MTRAFKRLVTALTGMTLAAVLCSCGGGGGGGNLSGGGGSGGGGGGGGGGVSGSNVVAVNVSKGPTGGSFNQLFTTITICLPGTSTCQTIDNIQVDTQSFGLRVLSSALTLALPTQTTGGGALLECLAFVDGYVWGPVALGDVQISGETASNIPLQVIGDSRYPNVPTDCASLGDPENTVQTFLANGILGIGPVQYDCGTACSNGAQQEAYYSCTSSAASSCSAVATPLAQQVQNVEDQFAVDNNGIILDLPSVSNPAVGVGTLTGSLIFGIDTQTNNASGTQTILTTDSSGDLLITYNGRQYADSFIDSGTNGIYFNDNTIPVCTQNNFTDFYCPASTLSLSATMRGSSGVTAMISFGVANTYNMVNNNPTFAVFPDAGGTYPTDANTFDFGLPFFYGRRVAVAAVGATTAVGSGPYIAF